MMDHNALYHMGCYAKLKDSHNDRLVKKREKEKRELGTWRMQRFHIKERLNLLWRFAQRRDWLFIASENNSTDHFVQPQKQELKQFDH